MNTSMPCVLVWLNRHVGIITNTFQYIWCWCRDEHFALNYYGEWDYFQWCDIFSCWFKTKDHGTSKDLRIFFKLILKSTTTHFVSIWYHRFHSLKLKLFLKYYICDFGDAIFFWSSMKDLGTSKNPIFSQLDAKSQVRPHFA
jgi:hypothetical protein